VQPASFLAASGFIIYGSRSSEKDSVSPHAYPGRNSTRRPSWNYPSLENSSRCLSKANPANPPPFRSLAYYIHFWDLH
jgi:hypothetical protein